MPRATLKPVAADMTAKVQCLWKPAQSGKTRAIQDMIRADDGYNKHLNIIICSKNRLLAAQTARRMEDDRAAAEADAMSVDTDNLDGDDVIADGVYCWMSGTKKTNIKAAELAIKVFRGEVSMVVCCAHKARFQYLHEMLSILEDIRYPKPVNVWLDEADAYVNLWADEFDFSARNCVREIHPVSATFSKLIDRLGRIRVKALPDTHPECYRGLRDCKLVEEENCRNPVDFLAAMLDKYPKLSAPGSKLFAPGLFKRKSHDDVLGLLAEKGFAVLILNGERKQFHLPDGTVYPIELSVDGEELSGVLADKYAELGLKRYPFAVTGHLCLNRGITFQSRKFVFTAGILPDIADPDDAYQCIARVLGNTRDFAKKTPTVYMSHEMKTATTRQERIAINIARLVHENEWATVGEDEVERAAHDTEEAYLAARAVALERARAEAREEAERLAAERETLIDCGNGPGEKPKTYKSIEAAVAALTRTTGRAPTRVPEVQTEGEFAGYYRSPASPKPMTKEKFEEWRTSKTAQGRKRLERGDPPQRRIVVYYTNISDPTTCRFVIRTLYRPAA
jgi:hypothetical protein